MRSLLAFALGSLSLVGISTSAVRAQIQSKFPAPVLIPFELKSGFLIVVQGQIGTVGALRFIVE